MIAQTPDPAVIELKRVVETQLKVKTKFVYANLYEANITLDELDDETEFPVFVFLSTAVSREKKDSNGLITRTIPVVGFMLDVKDDPTNEYTTEDADPYINRMRQLGENLLYNLDKSAFTDLNMPYPSDDCLYEKLYGKFDKHTFGVSMSFNWAFNTGVSGCFA